ncbi:MAG: hypothetical protein M3Y81_18860 [Chloroflexota bacterium]|nr:hypothetical protein [Chloroflexota bacterium]
MSISSRSRVSIILTLLALASILGFYVAQEAMQGKTANAASLKTSSSYRFHKGHLEQGTLVDPRHLAAAKKTANSSNIRVLPALSIPGKGRNAAIKSTPARANANLKAAAAGHALLHNFEGSNVFDNFFANGGDLEPPDQGLCVGNGFVMEPVNLTVGFFNTNGVRLNEPVPMSAFFGETATGPTVQGDPRCYYDKSTNAWFATMLFVDLTNNVSHFDVAVNPSGDPTTTWKVYRLPTTDGPGAFSPDPGCPCFGDQPLLGIDQYNLYVTTNEFSISAITGGPVFFNGAQVYPISKSQLVAEASSVLFGQYNNLSIGGAIAASLQPAITNGNPAAEYFVSSLDPNGTFDHRLAVWALTTPQILSTGGISNFNGVLVNSETYGLPPNAVDPGGHVITTDDDRMQQVQYINGHLWGALDTSITIPGDSAQRSGVAWFEIHPSLTKDQLAIAHASMTAQGYVVSHGNYLLYPAITVSPDGTAAMVMSLSGPGVYPSAVFAIRPAGSSNFGGIRFLAAGVANDNGFTCTPGPCRWGDYSAAVLDPNNSHGIWMATEYIGGPGDTNANWDTRIAEVQA